MTPFDAIDTLRARRGRLRPEGRHDLGRLPAVLPHARTAVRLRAVLELRAPGRGAPRGHIHVAWNSPLAWLQAERVAARSAGAAEAIAMRDTDRDLTRRARPLRQRDRHRRRLKRQDRRRRRARLAAGDADSAATSPSRARARATTSRCGVRHARRQARRSHRRRARRGPRAAPRRGRRRVHDRRQSPGVRARGHTSCSARRGSAQTPAYDHCNFTVLDDAPAELVDALPRAAAAHVVRRSGGPAAARPRGPEAVAARPRHGLRAARAPSTDSARSTRSSSELRGAMQRRSRPSASPRAATCWSSARCARAAGRDVAVAGRRRSSPWTCGPGAGRRATASMAAGAGGDRGHAVIVDGGAEAERWAGASARGDGRPPTPTPSPSIRRALGAGGARRVVEAGAPEFDFPLADKTRSGPTRRRASTRRRPPRSGTRRPRSRGTRRSNLPTSRGRGRPGDDVPDRERDRGADRAGRFLAQLHPHFREVMQVLAIQAADEARHIEVFTRRALLKREPAGPVDGRRPGVAQDAGRGAGLRARVVPALGARRGHLSVAALVPRAVRARSGDAAVARLAAQDEARHVAFGLAHLGQHLRARARLPPAPRRRRAAAARRASPHRRAQRGGVRRAGAARRRLVGADALRRARDACCS